MSVRVLFGKVALNREFCSFCNRYALVIDGLLACCDRNALEAPKSFKREVQIGIGKRDHLKKSEKKAILEEQDDRCLYCGQRFGSVVLRHGDPIVLRIHYDHMCPWAYVGTTTRQNIAAACHVCNLIKRDRIFQTVEEASVYIQTTREKKGYLVL
jgi:5-methylcytosine-specific restriction endonuclease McrA